MSDPRDNSNNGDAASGTTEPRPPYASYIQSIYQNGLLAGQLPVVTTNPSLLEDQARKAMSPEAFNYILGGAGEMSTMDANRLAFRQWKIVPRLLKPCSPRDLKTDLFGMTYDSPVLMAPIGVQGVFHKAAEPAVAAACADLGVPYTLSTASTTSIEALAAAHGSAAPRWFQLYWPVSRDLTASLLRRARAAGFSALVVTLDTVTVSWRPLDLDAAYIPFVTGTGNAVGFSDPVFRARFARDNDGDAPEDSPVLASRAWISEVFGGEHHAWDEIAHLRDAWDGPIVLKGILDPRDARAAADAGVDGIIVSNHGGRQLDGAVASLEMLPDIVDAVGDRMTVMFDSGIRTGADIVKALALGAKAVFVGRPVVYGLGIAGQEGAKAVLAGLLADLDQTMGLAGFKSVADLQRSCLRRTNYGGDVKSNL